MKTFFYKLIGFIGLLNTSAYAELNLGKLGKLNSEIGVSGATLQEQGKTIGEWVVIGVVFVIIITSLWLAFAGVASAYQKHISGDTKGPSLGSALGWGLLILVLGFTIATTIYKIFL